jgi:2-polyprenyl-6-methoxyphenol hydroxylase-like FAD-dependent oxidoreductase
MRQLRQRHGQWGDPVVQHIIQAANIQSMYPTWTVPPLPTWERDGVILVGDAAHALPSTSGQGSSQALEDCEALAILLAHQLGSLEGKKQEPTAQKDAINGAAKLYVTLRRPHVQEILEAARRMQNSKREMGVIQEYMMYGFMKLFGKAHDITLAIGRH